MLNVTLAEVGAGVEAGGRGGSGGCARRGAALTARLES